MSKLFSQVLLVLTVCVPAFLAPLSGVTYAQSAPLSLKILTLNFNSEIMIEDIDFSIRDRRYAALKGWIEMNTPDIILMQEAWSYRNGQNISEAIAEAENFDVIYQTEMGVLSIYDEGVAILAKIALKMSQTAALELPDSALVDLTVSYAVFAKLQLSDGEPAFVYTQHLNGSSPADRGTQAQAVLADLNQRLHSEGISLNQAQVIIGGDFNSSPSEPAPSVLAQAGFVDTFAKAHPGNQDCSNCADPGLDWFNPMTILPGQFPSQAGETGDARVDYIFSHSPNLQSQSSVFTFSTWLNDVWMSDHYGVTTVLTTSKAPVGHYSRQGASWTMNG